MLEVSSFYVVRNTETGQIWDRQLFSGAIEAEIFARKLVGSWEVKPANLSDFTDRNSKVYIASSGSIANQIEVVVGSHALICGDPQIGKLKEKLELIVLLKERYDLPVLVLFRNNNVDLFQFIYRLDQFNAEQRKQGKPTIPPPIVDILSHKERLNELLRGPNVLLGLANPDTIAMFDKCLESNPELLKKLFVIVDEADLVTFELNNEGLKTKTELNLSSLFERIYMLFSVTGTPGSILLCDKVNQVYAIDQPDNYFGINKIVHRPVTPVRAKGKNKQYDPNLDKENLKRIVDDTLKLEQSTLLISVSRIRREHKDVIKYLSKLHTDKDMIYLEHNEKSIKVYDRNGDQIEHISKPFKGKKIGPIDVALQKYINRKHIVIVAGILAGRGVSFVSSDYTRHLTHQYIADAEGSHLESALQSVRLLGKYNDSPLLTLYCSTSLYDDLKCQSEDMKSYVELAKIARKEKEQLPNVLLAQKKYDHRWFAPRKLKGISYSTPVKGASRSPSYELVIEEYNESAKAQFSIEPILTNFVWDFPGMLLMGNWPGGKNYSGTNCGRKERVIYCNPLSDFEEEGMKKFFTVKRVTSRIKEQLLFRGHPRMDKIRELYKKHPEFVGKIIRKVENEEDGSPTLVRKPFTTKPEGILDDPAFQQNMLF